MDFDERFSREELKSHLRRIPGLGILTEDHMYDEFLDSRRTNRKRTGNEFSFKPIQLAIGEGANGAFHERYSATVADNGRDPLTNKVLPSSLWIRFERNEFQFRLFAQDGLHSNTRGFNGRIPFQDIIRGGIYLKTGPVNYVPSETAKMETCVIVRLSRPPRLVIGLDFATVPSPDRKGKSTFDRVATEADFYHPEAVESEAGMISPLGHPNALIKPGLWHMYKFTLQMSYKQYKLIWMCFVRLRTLGLCPNFSEPDRPLPLPIETYEAFDERWPSIPFDIRYLLEALISTGTIIQSEVPELLSRLNSSTRCIEVLEALHGSTRQGSILEDVERMLPKIRSKHPVPSHCVKVRRCLVTPLRLILLPPEVEGGNSILRDYEPYQDQFIRVHFMGENDELEASMATQEIDRHLSQTGQFARVRRALRYGLQIAGRRYVFLASSASQAKERGCWMLAEEPPHFTRAKVIEGMGDLSRLRIVATYASRLGLAFSATRAVTGIDLDVVVQKDPYDKIDSVTGRRMRFTDGVGLCSQSLANKMAETLGQPNLRMSAAQIRMPGVKGVLCVSPTVSGSKIVLRDTMVKFKSDHVAMSIMKVADYHPVTLNRQAILLLEALGVPMEMFLMMFDEYKESIENLGGNSNSIALANQSTFPLEKALKAGFKDDPMVINAMRVIKCRLLSDLKWKAWIPVVKGALLVGVADETNTLNEGEVFCQMCKGDRMEVIERDCVIYRNPCLHPGDVRRVRAVANPHLMDLVNVVVFPVKGDRSLADMLSGGDFDGDEYSLIWDERLIIPRNQEPMDYSAPPAPPEVENMTAEKTAEFFLEYIMKDSLGVVCNAHLARADKLGPMDDGCKKLARVASRALDYHKTGVTVDSADWKDLRPSSWPDFMGEEDGRVIRTSTNALGFMFRKIDPDPVFEPYREYDYVHAKVERVDCGVYLAEAKKMKEQYDLELAHLIRSQGLSSEAECVTGFPLRGTQFRLRKERDVPRRVTLREGYERLSQSFIKDSRKYLREGVADGKSEEERWAAACYRVSYAGATGTTLLSFPWIFWEDLVTL